MSKGPLMLYLFLQRDIFWFYLNDEDLMSKTFNEGCADLQQYPASKVCQLAKKLESSKATARHIKQATSNPQAAQINLLRHQRTELAPKKRKGHKCKQHFNTSNQRKADHLKRNGSTYHRPRAQITALSVVILGMPKASPVQQRSTNARLAKSMDTLLASASQSRDLAQSIVLTKSQLRR